MDLKEILKNKLRNAGLSEELADTLNITDESQIEGVIQLLKKPTQPTDFEKLLTSDEFNQFAESKGFDGVLALSKFLQSKHDQKVTQGIETFKAKQNQKPDTSKEGEPNSDYLKRLQDLEEKLEEKLLEHSKKEERSKKMELVKQAMSKSKLPEKFQNKWIGRINLDEDYNKQIQDLEAEHDELYGLFVKSNSGSGLPTGRPVSGEPADEEVETILNKM